MQFSIPPRFGQDSARKDGPYQNDVTRRIKVLPRSGGNGRVVCMKKPTSESFLEENMGHFLNQAEFNGDIFWFGISSLLRHAE